MMTKNLPSILLAAVFLAGGVVLTVTGHAAEAAGCYGTATGIALGGGTAAVQAKRAKPVRRRKAPAAKRSTSK